jgi:EcsC protein family
MFGKMPKIPKSAARSPFGGLFRFAVLRGLRSVEIDPEEFRAYLAKKHKLYVSGFDRMHEVPLEKLDSIARSLIRNAGKWALAEGAGFGLGGVLTLVPDASLLTIITLRLIQRLCLLYGFNPESLDQRRELWLAAAAATGVDFGKDLAEKQVMEKVVPRIAERLALSLGEDAAGKWVGRLVPLASSAIAGGLNFMFVRAWGHRVRKNLSARHFAERPAAVPHLSLLPISVGTA